MSSAPAVPQNRQSARRRVSERAILGMSVSGNTDHLARSARERETDLTRGDFCAKREAPDAALELIDHPKAASRVGPGSPERLPPAAVMNEQVDKRALLRDRSLHGARDDDGALRASPTRRDLEPHAGCDRLLECC